MKTGFVLFWGVLAALFVWAGIAVGTQSANPVDDLQFVRLNVLGVDQFYELGRNANRGDKFETGDLVPIYVFDPSAVTPGDGSEGIVEVITVSLGQRVVPAATIPGPDGLFTRANQFTGTTPRELRSVGSLPVYQYFEGEIVSRVPR